MNTSNLVICKNCNNEHKGNYCNNCGQKLITNRFTLRIIFKDITQEIFNLDKGFFYTIKELIINPRKVIKEYLNGRTKAYFNPIKFLVLIAGLLTLIILATNILDRNINTTNQYTQELAGVNIEKMPEWVSNFQSKVKNYMNVFMILMVPFYTLGFRFLYPKENLNYTEHLIINCYAFSIGNIFTLVSSLTLLFIPSFLILDQLFSFIIVILFYTYFYKRIVGGNIIVTFLKSLFSMLTGLILFLITFMFLTFIIVFILKKLSII